MYKSYLLTYNGEWKLWTRGTFEECLEDFFDLRNGTYGNGTYIGYRLEYINEGTSENG